ncbi:transcription termination factor 5, mitochondrial-like [Phthorimaea operculella]|nr:transcription termination factor 5, mitochondrial-like [Phthorimaea operculella]
MILDKVLRVGLLWRPFYHRTVVLMNGYERSLSALCNHLNITEIQAEYLSLKQPVVKKLTETKIKELIDTLEELGYPKNSLLEEPLLFGMLPITLKFRHQVLCECAFQEVSIKHILSYLPLVKQKTIGYLKNRNEIPAVINIENRLASYMTQWPTSLTTLIYGDINDCTLHVLRLKIIQRYLELVLDLTKEEFERGIETYPTIKHRPLAVINETLKILQSQIMMPPHKIKNNLYLIHADPDNLKNIIYKLKTIGGIDIKEVLRLHPKLATKNYTTLVEIRKVLQEYEISNEAQMRCFEIYTLSPTTIRDRLEKAKTIPEFSAFFKHPRFLRMIHFKNTAMKRLAKLYDNNKKCLSLNILSGSSAHYETFEKAPGDRMGKVKDLVFCISQSLGSKYKKSDIRNKIKRHPFWLNIPLVQVQYVYQKLSAEFSPEDIYHNCPILLYPWSKIREALNLLKRNPNEGLLRLFGENLDLNQLNKSQTLSLVLYLLEKNHYFTGNGVWIEEKNKTIDTVMAELVKSNAL